MGWTSYHASYYKNGKVDRKAECDAYFLKGLNRGNFAVEKSVMKGSVYYAAIRNLVKEENGTFVPLEEKDQEVWAAVFLTSTDSKDYFNFSYKPMDETYGPCESKCPVSILKLLSETENEFANAWREACLAYAKSEKQKRALDRFPVGTKICFPVLSDMGKDIKKGDIIHLWKTASGNWIDGQYRWAKKLIGDYVVE